MAKCVIPLVSGLFEAIKGLVEVFDQLPLIVVAGGRLHVDVFIFTQLSIEVCAVEVKCVDVPVMSGGDSENGVETREFSNRRESVEIVHTKLLHKPLCNEVCLVFFNKTIGV